MNAHAKALNPPHSGRSGASLPELARQPLVQLLLGITLAAQIIAVNAAGVGNAEHWSIREAITTVELAPAIVTPDFSVRNAWLKHAVERETTRLATIYQKQGYKLTPALAQQIGEAATEFEIDPEIAFGLVRAESSFRNAATSRVGAIGLTQLMPRTAAWIEPGITRAELRDPETNLRVGFKYLRYLIDKYDGNEKLALLAYNRGPGTVDRALKRGRDPDNGYADFVYGKANHGHRLFTR